MPTIEVDFETFKAITLRRPREEVSEGEVVRHAMGLPVEWLATISLDPSPDANPVWRSEGVTFLVGTRLRHLFRDGTRVDAEIVEGGVKVNGKNFNDLSPAAVEVTSCQQNGWTFWEVERPDGSWMKATYLRSSK